jgi:hypothetical protein
VRIFASENVLLLKIDRDRVDAGDFGDFGGGQLERRLRRRTQKK